MRLHFRVLRREFELAMTSRAVHSRFVAGANWRRIMSLFSSMFARPLFAKQFARQSIWQGVSQRTLVTHSAVASRAAAPRSLPLLFTAAGIAGVGLSAFARPKILCEPLATPTVPVTTPPQVADPSYPPPPSSSVNVYELSFGTVCGLCAGVFIKKGAKAIAFLLGGAFVLLQYLGSASVVRVDWGKMGSRFENLFYTKDPITGTKRAPSVGSLFNWIVDFLTANFQQRASFVAGLALGLRIG
ncbi:hypothetical protein HWV62_32955 [Athelia sp. TMB]|nr:hypothetical protein HWV62_32955 [Athelia sp. TMB]